jgi:6-phosphogluconolactonase
MSRVMTTRIARVFADAEAVSHAAAVEFVRCASEAQAARGRFTVALSGGSTPQRLFQLLAAPPFRGQVDWKRIHFFWGDERCVPPDHKDSNYRMAMEALLGPVGVPTNNVHRIQAERGDRAAAARDYQQEIARVFGVDPTGTPPSFDLILLGMGPDGHTASLFPDTGALTEEKAWVVVNYVLKFATDRITMTLPILNRGRQVLFLVAGTDKAQRLAEVLEGPPNPQWLPSQSINSTCGPVLWFTDRLAAANLTQTGLSEDPGT